MYIHKDQEYSLDLYSKVQNLKWMNLREGIPLIGLTLEMESPESG